MFPNVALFGGVSRGKSDMRRMQIFTLALHSNQKNICQVKKKYSHFAKSNNQLCFRSVKVKIISFVNGVLYVLNNFFYTVLKFSARFKIEKLYHMKNRKKCFFHDNNT